MTRVSCPSCRLRFTGALAVHLTSCPECGGDLEPASAAETLGYRLFTFTDPVPLPLAGEAALPPELPHPRPRD